MAKPKRTIGRVVGSGLLAGFAGTVVMTALQKLQTRMANRRPSTAPAKALEKLLKIEAKDERAELRLARATHWSYGSGWGVARAILRELGLGPARATLAQFGLLQSAEQVVLRRLKVVPPLGMKTKKEIAQELALQGLYASVTGLSYDALRSLRARRGLQRARRRLRARLSGGPAWRARVVGLLPELPARL
jgi:hypothetical protein